MAGRSDLFEPSFRVSLARVSESISSSPITTSVMLSQYAFLVLLEDENARRRLLDQKDNSGNDGAGAMLREDPHLMPTGELGMLGDEGATV